MARINDSRLIQLNLTEVIVRADDGFDDLRCKVRNATILGTLQSSLTDFRYLSKKWKENCEEERLLGVSLTGIMDHPFLSGNDPFHFGSTTEAELYDDGEFTRSVHEIPIHDLPTILEALKREAIETNKEISEKLAINPSTAITCVKPSGTVSQLCNTASGIHPRHSKFYIRRVRNDVKDPLAAFLCDAGVPSEPDRGSTTNAALVFSFPIKAPEGAITREDLTAIQHLELWKIYAEHWCEHKPSITVSVKEDEWLEVGAWVYKNFDLLSGISFLPYSDHTYEQAPYEELDQRVYENLQRTFNRIEINFEHLSEREDNTEGSQELACMAGHCEI